MFKFDIPSLRGLFKTIEGLAKLADIMWSGFVNEAGKLHHIYIFHKRPLKECIIDIYLTKGPTSRNGKRE